MGSGGSNNLILIGAKPYVIKLYPEYKVIRDGHKSIWKDKYEIKFFKLLTKEFLLTNKSQHLVGFYKSFKCDDMSKILPKNLTCPKTKEKFLLTKLNKDQKKFCGTIFFLSLDRKNIPRFILHSMNVK